MSTLKTLFISLLLFYGVEASGQTMDDIDSSKFISIPETESSAYAPTIYVSFAVETTGKITNIKVAKVNCKKCSKRKKESLKAEALRVASKMPDFKPTEKRTWFLLPMKFNLTED